MRVYDRKWAAAENDTEAAGLTSAGAIVPQRRGGHLFVDLPWVLPEPELDDMRHGAAWYAPAAFICHGVLPDPSDLDRRGGERRDWVA